MPTGIYIRTELAKKNMSKAHVGLNNKGLYKKGHIVTQETREKLKRAKLGKHQSIEARQKIGFAHTGAKNFSWKGDEASYVAIHIWISKWKGTPKKCERCGTTTAKKFEWANIDHKYRRILDDYIRMCTSCHRLYDNSRIIKIKH